MRTTSESFGDSLVFRGYQNFVLRKNYLFPGACDRKLLLKYRSLEPLATKLFSGRTVLDLGANAGFFSYLAILNGATKAAAVEIDPVNAKALKEASAQFGFNIEVLQCSVENTEIAAETVIALSVVHWLSASSTSLKVFSGIDAMVKRLASMTKETLVLEWMDEDDVTVKSWPRIPDDYSPVYLEAALSRYFNRFETIPRRVASRQIYLAHKNEKGVV